MTPCHFSDKNRAGDFVSKNSAYGANITSSNFFFQIQMAYDNDMRSSLVVNIAFRHEPMMWLTHVPRPLPLLYCPKWLWLFKTSITPRNFFFVRWGQERAPYLTTLFPTVAHVYHTKCGPRNFFGVRQS
jgi:hypothetical protein